MPCSSNCRFGSNVFFLAVLPRYSFVHWFFFMLLFPLVFLCKVAIHANLTSYVASYCFIYIVLPDQ